MARKGDFPPLFTFPVVSVIFAIGKWLFGGGNKQAQRDKLFKQHRERNAARGWQPGDNVLRANVEAEARRSAAERALQKVNETIGTLGVAPWVLRAKLGKSGKLYTIRDVQKNVVRRDASVVKTKVEALKKEAARQQRTRDTGTFTRRGIRGTTGGLADAAVFLVDTLQQESLRRLVEQQRASARVLRATNRRGALAARPLQPRTRTNRTAAGDAGRVPRSAGRSASVRSAPVAGTQPQQQAARPVATQQAPGESAASREARAVLGRSATLPMGTSTYPLNPLVQAAQLGMAAVLANPPRLSTRQSTASSGLNSLRSRLTTGGGMGQLPTLRSGAPLSLGTRLTPLEATGVASASCNCPKPKEPKKQTKERKERCSNPVVSRSVEGDLQTTVRKLVCQPSRPKSPSPPTPPTTTSSTAPPSSTPAGGSSSPLVSLLRPLARL